MTLALSKVWSPRPISLSIVEVLEKKGSLTDIDLQKELKSNFGEVSFRELNTNLMRLEMQGVLRVSRLMKGKRQVELVGKPVIDSNNVRNNSKPFWRGCSAKVRLLCGHWSLVEGCDPRKAPGDGLLSTLSRVRRWWIRGHE